LILRPDGDAVLAIGQASHAWLAGQLARAWGNGRFAAPEPFEEVVLGAVQHDIGMAGWDLRPERHPLSGLPVQFFELDRMTHLGLWSAAPRQVLSQSRYAALLVSLHGTGLYERFPPRTEDPEIARAVAAYLAGQRALQAELAEQVGATAEELARNQALLATWDLLSLALCQDKVPATTRLGGEPLTLVRVARDGEDEAFTLDPWPFAPPGCLEVRVEGRRLEGAPYADDAALLGALERAPVLTLRMVLRPA
jgi:hypothetical protein